ncbi:MAG TPA: MBL fold metallo-hydrolase [Methanomicrobiales archaeon]|nr:MBL fold metallo-hydrolase [Methanomicrobiales archaeon]
MIFEKVVSVGLAHNSYLVGSGGEAAVIDPRRDIDVYLDIAREEDLRITHVFETHRNEDYVIGSLELARATGCEIHHGGRLDFGYGSPVREGDSFRVGTLELRILETPGHTEESISLVLLDTEVSGTPLMVFTGDALFAGEVGRTDFYPDRMEQVAGELHDSLHRKILPLGDGVIICPAHGGGSVCGADISDLPWTTIGYERETSPILRLERGAFIRKKVAERHHYPAYFSMMEKLNHEGSPPLAWPLFLLNLTVPSVAELRKKGAQVVDIRSPASFAGGHLPGSLHVWREGLSAFIGYYLNYDDPIVVVDDFNEDLVEVRREFARLGYDNLAGCLEGGFMAWAKAAEPVGRVTSWTVHDLKAHLGDPSLFLLDLRDEPNYRKHGHLPGAHQVYAGEFPSFICKVPEDMDIVCFCDAGYKSSIAASLLLRAGFTRVTVVLGSMAAWEKAGYPVEKESGERKDAERGGTQGLEIGPS